MIDLCGQTLLVTGGAGAIGTNLVRRLVRTEAARIVILDDFSSAFHWNVPRDAKVVLMQGSILDEMALAAAFAYRPALVFHLAALFANANSIEHPQQDLMINGMGTLMVLQHAVRAGVRRLVYSSSGCSVYSHDTPLPFEERNVSIHLRTPYQISKLLGEMYCHYFTSYYGLDTVRLRLFNAYGPGEVPGRYRNVLPNFIYWALRGRPLPILGDGSETRDFTFVGDMVQGLLAAATAGPAACGDVFNLSTSRQVTIATVADLVNELTGNRAGTVQRAPREWDKKRNVLASNKKAVNALGFAPLTDFREGVRQTVDWFQDHWEQICADADFPEATTPAG